MHSWPELPTLTEAEARLQHDAVFGFLDYPADLQKRDDYFREGLKLLRTVTNQPVKLQRVISDYLHFATSPALRLELDAFLQSLPTPVPPKEEKSR
jgi:hypothetical protein